MTTFAYSNHVELMEIDNEWIAMDTKNYTVTKINKMGAFILGCVKEQRSVEDIVQLIDEKYEVNSNEVKSIVHSFLIELKKLGLIT